jgi:hypothetical protein
VVQLVTFGFFTIVNRGHPTSGALTVRDTN